jgi:hypothetical protein
MSLWPGRSDRLGRSLQDLIAFLSDLHALKVDLFLKSQGIDTTKSSPRARRNAASKDLDPGFQRPQLSGKFLHAARRADPHPATATSSVFASFVIRSTSYAGYLK